MREDRAVLGEEVIDVSRDPRAAKVASRRRLLRVAVPFLAAAALVAAALGMVAIGHVGNRAEALRLADTVLEALENRIETEVAAWLGPAERAVRLMAELHAGETLGRDAARMGDFGAGLLSAVPQIAAVFYGNADGAFVMARREGDKTIAIKTIEPHPQRRVFIEVRDLGADSVRQLEAVDDGFDPRTRPWFTGAMASAGIHWTEIYVFFTDRVPGLTVSLALPARENRPAAVVGADIRLDTLSHFLSTLRVGTSGTAMILDRAGRLVAFPEADRTIRQDGEALKPVRLDQLEDPVLTRAFDALRLEGPGRRAMAIGGERYISLSTPLDTLVGRDWVLMLVVPEDDLVGFVGRNSRVALAAGAVVALLALILAALSVREGLRADARARDLDRHRRETEAETNALAQLANDPDVGDPQAPRGLQRITETIARAVSARRVSLWRIVAGRRSLAAADIFDADTALHSAAVQLSAETIGEAIAPLAMGRLEIDAARPEPRFAALSKLYLATSGTRRLLSVPIRSAGETVALLWIEDAAAAPDGVRAFAEAAAAVLARRFRLEAGNGVGLRSSTAPVSQPGEPSRATAEARRPGSGFLSRLAALGVGSKEGDVEPFTDATVLVLLFTDPATLAARSASDRPLATEAVSAIRRVLEREGVGYLRLVAQSMIAASGLDGDPAAGARRMSQAALALQEAMVRLFLDADQRPAFRIGIATGDALGVVVDEDGGGFNLWGEAVEAATALAESAAEGMIQVGERTYALAADTFLVRPRGRFWLEGRGETATYYLMART
ncbi:MAG: cache domain-containing protein [Elioraea sp.]|nr:cache domain-containing protein [Elioraea sp.]